jgi:hypothetical protein
VSALDWLTIAAIAASMVAAGMARTRRDWPWLVVFAAAATLLALGLLGRLAGVFA